MSMFGCGGVLLPGEIYGANLLNLHSRMEGPVTENTKTAGRFTLRKAEKLRHKSLADSLFRKGESLYCFPLRLAWRKLSAEELKSSFRMDVPQKIDSLQMLITIPKKKRKRAVDRVLLRRRIREAYRLNRLPLKKLTDSLPDHGSLSLAFIYIHDKNSDYRVIEKAMITLLSKLQKTLS